MYISVDTVLSWPKANYVNPVQRGSSIIIVNVFLFAIVLLIVLLRIYTRVRISRCFGGDDAFILLAMLFTAALLVIITMAQLRYGWNRHAWDVLPTMVSTGLKLSLLTQILFAAASGCTRLSMLILTRRIISTALPRLQKLITFAMILATSTAVIFVVVAIFQCRPISAYWTISLTPQKCITGKWFLLCMGVLNIIADFLVVLIPIPVVLGLRLPLKQRIIVSFLFGAGFIVCIAGIFRTYYFYKLTSRYHDITWDAIPVWIATVVELYLGIVCTSIPPTKQFFARYIPKLISATTGYTQSSQRSWPKLPNSLRGPNTSGSKSTHDGKVKVTTAVDISFNDLSSKSCNRPSIHSQQSDSFSLPLQGRVYDRQGSTGRLLDTE